MSSKPPPRKPRSSHDLAMPTAKKIITNMALADLAAWVVVAAKAVAVWNA